MSETQLAPCPFCGPGQSIVAVYEDCSGWSVGCGRCGSHSGHRPPSDPEGRAKVIALWNQRPEVETLRQTFSSLSFILCGQGNPDGGKIPEQLEALIHNTNNALKVIYDALVDLENGKYQS